MSAARTTPLALSRALTALGLLVIGASVGCAPPPIDEDGTNLQPVAHLVWPQRWSTDEAAPFDASASEDPDGRLARVTLSFGDGTPDQDALDGTFEHLYTAPGSYDVRLEVVDDDGATAEVLGTVVVVDRIDDPPCSCELPCFDDAVCTDDGCFLAAASEAIGDGGPGDGHLPPGVVCE